MIRCITVCWVAALGILHFGNEDFPLQILAVPLAIGTLPALMLFSVNEWLRHD